MVEPTRVLVVEDHPLYRQAVCALVESMDGWTVIGAHGDADGALASASDADLVVLDLGLPGTDGVRAIRLLKEINPSLVVVVLTMSEEPTTLSAAVRSGAQGYLVKGSEPEDIQRALRAAIRGQAVFGAQVAAAVLAHTARSHPVAQEAFPTLTTRELEVFDLLAAGRSNDEIAAALFVSPKTVRNQVSSILTKLGATRAQAISRGRGAGLGSR